MHVHEEVLLAANEIAGRSKGVFTIPQVLNALPNLNEQTVRTHIASRCCVNAPKNHPHRWGYFRRVGYGKYEVVPEYRGKRKPPVRAISKGPAMPPGGQGGQRDTIHAVVSLADGIYTAECLEVAVVTQAESMDELLTDLHDALALHLEGEDMAAFGLSANPRLQILYETPLAV